MNTLRALIFGTVVAASLIVTLDTVVAAEPPVTSPQVVHLDAVQVTGHRHNFDADGNLKVVRLDQVSVIAHRASIVAA